MGLLNRNKDCVSVVLNDEVLRIAHLRITPPKAEVLNVIQRDIRGISENEIPKIVQTALNDFNIKKPDAICAISANVTTTKNIEIPSLDPEEIKSIIDLQAGRHTPYSREEIIIDYINIGVYQRNYSKILLIIVNRDIIKKQLAILEQAGLKVQKVLFIPESVADFYSKALNLNSSETPVGIIDISSQGTNFSIAFRGTVIACRSIPVGTVQLAAEGKAIYDNIVAEIKQSVDSYQSEDIEKAPKTFILTSDFSHAHEIQPLLKNALQADVKIVPYLDNISVSQSARDSIAKIGEDSFLDIIAPVVVMKESRIDLIPEETKMQRALERQGIEVAKSGVLALLILIFLGGTFGSKIYFKNKILNKLTTSHNVQRIEAKALEEISEKTKIIKDFLNSRLVSLETLNELYSIIPDEIYLRSIILTKEGTITIEGISESMSRAYSLVSDLEDSILFKGVKPVSMTAKKERGKDVAAFQIVLRLESAKDEEEGEDAEEDVEIEGAVETE